MSHVILFIAVAFFILQNWFFGWNAYPQSAAEVVCDGIVLLILAIALAVRAFTAVTSTT